MKLLLLAGRQKSQKLHKVVDFMGWRAILNKLTDYPKSGQVKWVATADVGVSPT